MKIIEKESKKYYQCEECGHIYETEKLANKCEAWCKEHKSCNLEIVKESVDIENKITGMPGFKLSPFKIHSVKNGQDQGIFIGI
jgi:predicted ATP-dependent serine protease